MTVRGIDVAWPQGAYNWDQQIGQIQFGMCKVTEGLTGSDPQFAHNWNSMWFMNATHTFPRFGYHFFHASDSPTAQAERFVAAVKAHGLLAGDNLVLDLESTEPNGSNDNVGPAETAAAAKTFLTTVDGLAPDHRVLVYTSPGFADTGACAGLSYWGLWVADYGVTSPAVPAPWSGWIFWQDGDDPIDTDVYNGDEAHLTSFCRMPASR